MKVIAFLPVKGRSERIENKNIKLLDGKPLFLYTLEKLLKCDFIDEVYLDTDSEYIIDLASETGCKIMKRDAKLATNKTDGHKLFINEVNFKDADIYIQILCTSPFIEIETIKKGVDTLKKSDYDSAVLIRKEKLYLWDDKKPKYDMNNIPNSVDLNNTIIETMGLYISKKTTALKYNRRFGKNIFFLEASPLESIDVNYKEEFNLATLIAAGKREKERELFKNISNIISTPILSDILDDMGINGVISNLNLNIQNKKIFGFAKTLKLQKLKKGDDYTGIYKALKSYENIIPNDIIVVENECEDFAYFGELNANLAIRAGAIGAIIGGKTRDAAAVCQLDFPVFSKGYTCKDVKNRATMHSINKKINLYGVSISPGDLIFGDSDGIVVIPAEHQNRIIKLALKVVQKEKSILNKIVIGEQSINLLEEFGEF